MPEREFDLVGGHPVLDLVNTVGWRPVPEKTRDRLPDFTAAIRWAVAAGVLDETTASTLAARADADPSSAAAALRRLVRLRERLYDVLTALARHRRPDHAVLAELHLDLARAMQRAVPAEELPLRSTLDVREPVDLTDQLTLLAGDLLRSPDLSRLGRCAAEDCGWLFLDRTRSHTRRWCSSADCGNRDRARRHHARHTGR